MEKQVQASRPRESRASPVKTALAVAGHAGYLLSLSAMVLFCLVLLPLALLPRVRSRFASLMLRAFLRFFVRRYLPAVRACRVAEIACAPADGAAPAVYVSNHRSSIDAILLLAILPPASLVIKSRYTRRIGYAFLVLFFDFISIRAGSAPSLRRAMDKSRSLIAAGRSLLVFPEGIRATSGRLLPFGDFAFRMAVEQGLPIVPLVIHGDRPFLNRQKGSWFPPETVQYRIRFLEPIGTAECRDPVLLSNLAAQRMSAALAEMDKRFLKTNPDTKDNEDAPVRPENDRGDSPAPRSVPVC